MVWHGGSPCYWREWFGIGKLTPSCIPVGLVAIGGNGLAQEKDAMGHPSCIPVSLVVLVEWPSLKSRSYRCAHAQIVCVYVSTSARLRGLKPLRLANRSEATSLLRSQLTMVYGKLDTSQLVHNCVDGVPLLPPTRRKAKAGRSGAAAPHYEPCSCIHGHVVARS